MFVLFWINYVSWNNLDVSSDDLIDRFTESKITFKILCNLTAAAGCQYGDLLNTKSSYNLISSFCRKDFENKFNLRSSAALFGVRTEGNVLASAELRGHHHCTGILWRQISRNALEYSPLDNWILLLQFLDSTHNRGGGVTCPALLTQSTPPTPTLARSSSLELKTKVNQISQLKRSVNPQLGDMTI